MRNERKCDVIFFKPGDITFASKDTLLQTLRLDKNETLTFPHVFF